MSHTLEREKGKKVPNNCNNTLGNETTRHGGENMKKKRDLYGRDRIFGVRHPTNPQT